MIAKAFESDHSFEFQRGSYYEDRDGGIELNDMIFV